MKSMNTRATLFWCAVAALLASGSFALWENVRVAENKGLEEAARYSEERRVNDETTGQALAMSRSATTLPEWEAVRAKAQGLPDPTKKHLTLLADVRTMELLADERDQLLANAGALFTANKNDPGVKENIAKALVLQERADALLQKIESVPGNGEWNKSLQYRKAYEKYRSLVFIENGEHGKALDIIADAVGNLTKGLDALPKDNRTELAIEFLYKRAKEEEAMMAKGESADRPRAFPGSGPQVPGTGGTNRPRQH